MPLYGTHPSLDLAEEPDDPVWRWFILNGPHGEKFLWHKYSMMPKDIFYLKEFINEKITDDPKFGSKARSIALKSLKIPNPIMIRKAIQVLCVLGEENDMDLIKEFLDNDDSSIVNDAKCCLFERGVKYK